MESYRTDPTYMYTIISKNLPTIPTPSMRFMLGSGTELVGRFRLFPSVRYCVLLPGAVWCGAVHTFSHTLPGTDYMTFCSHFMYMCFIIFNICAFYVCFMFYVIFIKINYYYYSLLTVR